MPMFFALLRGVNVGGKQRLPMAVLKAALMRAGAMAVQTYLQSGNAVFDAPAAQGGAVARKAMGGIARVAGFEPGVVVIGAEAFLRIARAHPGAAAGAEAKCLHVAFLSGPLTGAAWQSLAVERFPNEQVTRGPACLYIHFTQGVAGSKFTNQVIDRATGGLCTMRNWNTVQALAGMVG